MKKSENIILMAATGCYVGYMPVVPGTFGTIAGLLPAYGLSWFQLYISLLLLAGFSLLAVWTAGRAEKALGVTDPGCIVIDEIAGMAVALLGMPFTPVNCLAGFILFRFFDILKPPPVRQLDRNMGGGWGIVLDDIAAGILANIVLRIGNAVLN